MSILSDVAARCSEFGADLRRFRESRRLTVDELGVMLGISGNYVYMMERGKLAAAPVVHERFTQLSTAADIFAVSMCAGDRQRDIPIISWAQAGRATNYEEMPSDWQEVIPSSCPDQQAFGVRLVGDSMETRYHEGDVIIAMPNCAPKHLCLVLAKMTDSDGVLFKKFSINAKYPHRFRLSSFNPAYPPRVMTWDQVQWVYPIYCATERIGGRAVG